MTLSSVTKDPLLITCLSTLTVKLMRLRLKLQMLKELNKKAILNKTSVKAIMFAFNRKAYVAQGQWGSICRQGHPQHLHSSKTLFKIDGKDFGESVEKNLEEYGDEWKGVSVEDGKDTLYNPTKAKEEFAKAKEALQGQGVEFPIHLDLPVSSNLYRRSQASSIL